MGPCFFVVWGTKVRRRPAGLVADFCPGCLRVARFDVTSVQTAGHIYYIHLRWQEEAKFAECSLCGTLAQVHPGQSVASGAGDSQTLASLLTETNPKLAGQFGEIAKEVEENIPPADRDAHVLHHFCAHATEHAKHVSEQSSGWLGVIFILFAIVAGIVFANWGAIAGTVVSVLLFIALLFIRHRYIHRKTAKALRPRIERLLQAADIEWSTFEDGLTSRALNYPKLRRHFGRSAYDDLRVGQFTHVVVEGKDFYTPTLDDVPASATPSATAASATTAAAAPNEPPDLSLVRCAHCGKQVVLKDGVCPACRQ